MEAAGVDDDELASSEEGAGDLTLSVGPMFGEYRERDTVIRNHFNVRA